MTSTENERRRYSRIQFDSPILFVVKDRQIEGVLVDISLKGALVRIDPDQIPPLGVSGTLHINLHETEGRIDIEALIKHVDGDRAGYLCTSIDIDSVTHLTRLVELNLGSRELLERELSALIEK